MVGFLDIGLLVLKPQTATGTTDLSPQHQGPPNTWA